MEHQIRRPDCFHLSISYGVSFFFGKMPLICSWNPFFTTILEAAVHKYIEFYNNRRIQKKLTYLTLCTIQKEGMCITQGITDD